MRDAEGHLTGAPMLHSPEGARLFHVQLTLADAIRESGANYNATIATVGNSSRRHRENDFYGPESDSFDAYSRIMREGWRYGADRANAYKARLIDSLGGSIVVEEYAYSVEGGGELDIGRYLEGVPESVIHVVDSSRPANEGNIGDLITIAYNNCVSGGINWRSLAERGAALIALCDLLEAAGRAVEFRIVSTFRTYSPVKRDGETYVGACVDITVKRAGQPVDPMLFTALVTHASGFRRLIFALIEQLPRQFQNAMRGGYGQVGELTDTQARGRNDRVIYCGGALLGHGRDWNDENAVREWIIASLKAQGVELSLG